MAMIPHRLMFFISTVMFPADWKVSMVRQRDEKQESDQDVDVVLQEKDTDSPRHGDTPLRASLVDSTRLFMNTTR